MRYSMAMLGNFTFGLDTAAFQELERVRSYRWASQERIGRRAAQQFLGPDSETITLRGTIFPHFRGGLGQMSQLASMAELGEPQVLIYADGESSEGALLQAIASTAFGNAMGLWVVTEIRETRTILNADGTPRKIDFTIGLRQYGEDA